jgi:Coenzyme PQQ synthesis protein D (PqqD)
MPDEAKRPHFIRPELRADPTAPEAPTLEPTVSPAEVARAARAVLGADGPSHLRLGAPSLPPTSVLSPSRDVTWTLLDGEAVLLDLESGRYFTLNRTATVLWQMLDGRKSLAEVVTMLGERFAVEQEVALEQVRHLAARLVDLKVVELRA